jgi:lipoprotein-anchoring transpeptidase ErfK/SrfK
VAAAPASADTQALGAPAIFPTPRPNPSRGPVPGGTTPEAAGPNRPVQTVFEAQLALDREGIGCGSIDGLMGSQTRSALGAFQRKVGLPDTGLLDETTKAVLRIVPPVQTAYTVASNDLERLQPLQNTWLGKSEQPRLDYETILELVAEKAHAHPQFIRQLNPGFNWDVVSSGATVLLPAVEAPPLQSKAVMVRISLSRRVLEAFDAGSNLLAHFPCSIGRLAEKRPAGELHVTVVAPNPNYTFDPAVFPESEEGRRLGRKLILPPGPNNPVGSAWIGLDLPGYGVHGTPAPEMVGRTESHGCFRLANWNAERLLRLVSVGTPVRVEP